MSDTPSLFYNLKAQLFDFIPDVLLSLGVLVLGYLVARFTKYLVTRLFSYLGRLAKQKFEYLNFKQAGSFLGSAFFWLIIFSSVVLVTDILGLTVLTEWFQSIVQYIPNILAAILIIFAAVILSNLVSDMFLSVGKSTGIKYIASLVRIIRFLILFMATIIALDQVGLEISLLIDIIDIVLAALLFGGALAFGLGARTSISNILACYYLRKRYKEGDEVQVGKTRGVIIKIEATNVVMDNEIGQVTIPAKIFNETKSYLITKG